MKSVLIIDDNQNIQNTAEIMELAGYKVFSADNGKKGVELALKEKPDIIICDIMMPELDCYGVLHLLRKNPDTVNIPFIFLTTKTERADFRKGMKMIADDFVIKPFEKTELLTAVEIRLKRVEVLQQKYSLSPQGITQFWKDIKDAGIINQLSGQYDPEEYKKKQILYQEGNYPEFLYYLVKGKVKGFKTNEDGKDYITDVFSDGDFIGYPALIEEKNYDDSAIILEDAEIMQIPKEDFLQMIYTDINIAVKFIRIITQNVKEKEERLLNLAYSSLRKRVAKALVDLHGKYNTDSENNPIEVSREDIAHYVGTATESLIRTLSDFKMEELIEIKAGKIRIAQIENLKNLLY